MANNKEANKIVNVALKDVDGALKSITDTITNINGGVELLIPEAVSLKDASNNTETKDGMELKFRGNDKKEVNTAVQRTIERTIEERYKEITRYSNGGMYAKLFMAKQNKYLSSEFPNLEKSLKLFMTDVCYGSFFSAYDTTNNPFIVRKDGIVVEDKNVLDRVINLINPSASRKEDISKRSFNDLDFGASLLSRQDGYGFVRLVPHKKVLTDLYVKYVLKNAKTKGLRRPQSSIKPSSTESATLITEYLQEFGFESSNINTDFDLNNLPKQYVDALPESLIIRTEVDNTINTKGLERSPDGFEEYEEYVFGSESFKDFSERMLTGKTSTIAIYSNKREDKKKRHCYRIGFESNTLDEETAQTIYNGFFEEMDDNIVTDINCGLESADQNLTQFDTTVLNKLTFEEIYRLDTFTMMKKFEKHIEDIYDYGIEKYLNENKEASKPKLKLTPVERAIKNIIITNDNIINSLESEIITQASEIKTKAGLEASNPSTTPSFRSALTGGKFDASSFVKFGTTSVGDNVSKKMSDSLTKSIRIFDNVNGCSTMVLDNRRIIPLMMGNKNNGILYIERTHAEVEHLLATRSVISNPLSNGDSTMSIFQIDEEKKDETIGRLLFADTIKPVFERNASLNFLKDNADLMFTVKELLEETEVSKNDKMHGAFNDLGYFNLSKVSYIPPSELIMYTNGDGLGTSMFEKAFVPANACILARESYLSWVLVDGKGIVFITYPKGMNELSGAYGGNPVSEMLEETLVTRVSLKMGSTDNIRLSRPVITLPVGDNGAAEKIDVKEIKPPDFDIDHDTINRWDVEATGLVGYPSSMFTDLSGAGSQPELARKFESMDASIVLDIVNAQDKKIHSSNSLATKLLHARGGKEYASYTIEWNPPRPSRSNNNIKKEMIEEKKFVLQEYMEIFTSLLEDKPDWEAVKGNFTKVLKKELFKDDKLLMSSEDMYKEASEITKVELARNAEEVK